MKTIKICTWKNCSEKFSEYIFKRLESDKNFYQYPENIIIEKVGCMGNCEQCPNIKIDNEIFWYQNPAKSSEILRKILKNN